MGWLPRAGELWGDGETREAGRGFFQAAGLQGPSSLGSSTALPPWSSHFPVSPSSSSSGLKGDHPPHHHHPQEEEEMLLAAASGHVVLLGHLVCMSDAQGLEVLGVPVLGQ